MQVEEPALSSTTPRQDRKQAVLTRDGLNVLITTLASRGHTVIGPTVEDRHLVLREIRGIDALPAGWRDSQMPGRYQLERSENTRLFDCLTGAHSWKQFLFPARRRLWTALRQNGSLELVQEATERRRFAFIGVRSCDLAAIAIQDRVFMGGTYADPVYHERRRDAFIVAVNCTRSGRTCFCASMGTGPAATAGFDLALTEVDSGDELLYLVDVGTDRGADVLSEVPTAKPGEKLRASAAEALDRATREQIRSMDPEAARQSLLENLSISRWQKTAQRCLACGNCTMVCPTCFCFTVEDTTDLGGQSAERQQVWDTCFHLDHSYLHGGSVRRSIAARYRQWISHKLATWYDQFGSSGCVGCGRCITWCPVGIDITEEIEAINPAAATAEAPPTQAIRKSNESR